MNTQDKLINIVKKYSKSDMLEINPATSIKELKFDSLDLLEFQMAVDDEFGIEVEIDDFLKCITVVDIAVMVDSYRRSNEIL